MTGKGLTVYGRMRWGEGGCWRG